MTRLSVLIDEAKETGSQDFMQLISQVSRILTFETTHQGKLRLTGRLVHLPPTGEAVVIGDIHGDLNSLERILNETRFIEKAEAKANLYLVFLGDYGDRGPYSPEVYHVVFRLKTMFPEKVILLMGNHEGPEDLLAHPHDLPFHLQRKFGGAWHEVYKALTHLQRQLYTAVLVEKRCIMLHGGVPSMAKTLDDLAFAYEKHPKKRHLEEILWSDPSEGMRGTRPSPRGAGMLFGGDVTERFLRMLDVRCLIRGHESAGKGYKFNHNGRILTLFSRKGLPYFNRHGAYLTLDLSQTVKNAETLVPFIRQF